MQQAANHVFKMVMVIFQQLVDWHKQALVSFSAEVTGVCSQGEDAGVGHWFGLEFCQLYIQGSTRFQRGSDGRLNLVNKTVKLSVGWMFKIEVSMTDGLDGPIVYHKGTTRMFQGDMSVEDRLSGINNSARILEDLINGELQLRILSVINR